MRNEYNDLRGGDKVLISYSPDGGTTLAVNGKPIVTRPGSDLMKAMTQIWIGPDPVSENIKRLLLSGSC